MKLTEKELLAMGVVVEDYPTTYVETSAKLGKGTILKPSTYIYGNTVVGENCKIGPCSYLENVVVGNDTVITFSHVVDSTLDNEVEVGPYTRIRGHAHLMNKVSIGNFMEIKGSTLHEGVKAKHLSYLGDADIGAKTNIGCGTITANYDGKNKFKTVIGENVFIGSNSTIVAPVTIASNSFVAAGSTINKDVGEDDFAIARERQVNKVGYANVIKAKAQAIKDQKGK